MVTDGGEVGKWANYDDLLKNNWYDIKYRKLIRFSYFVF